MNINVAADRTASAGKAPFEVERLGARLGAEIHGLDLKQDLDAAAFQALEAALIEHKVIVLRDQHLSTEQHVATSRHFGELEVHPMRPQGAFPEILVLDNHKDNPVLSTDVWHSDTTFRKNPTKYTILRCQIMPKVGGDTLWADMEAAYEGLSDVFKGMIGGLRAVHDFKNFRVLFGKSEEDRAKLRKMEELFPNPSHPVVRTHPVTGRKSLYLSSHAGGIVGMPMPEARVLLRDLNEHATQPKFVYVHTWRPWDLVMWDNRQMMHRVRRYDESQPRDMRRTTVAGDAPTVAQMEAA